ncbi:hypothetical protein BC830DRAFT_1135593 [Chytriomyces sp. MP71]|nr:hypothetical protein BC830DRAFT_1135593 [Chytriomyces sp. MP71]
MLGAPLLALVLALCCPVAAQHPDKDVDRRDAQTLTYYGGPLLKNVEISTIFYGNAPFQSELTMFYTWFATSPVVDFLAAEYSTSKTTIGRGKYVGSVNQTSVGKQMLDDLQDLQPMIRRLVQAGSITANVNSFYAIHIAQGTRVMHGGQISCQDFCSYHSSVDVSDLNVGASRVTYGVFPYLDGLCTTGCGNSPLMLNNMCGLASHELTEAITNPLVNVATGYGPPLSWWSKTRNGEIGDLCNGIDGSVTDSVTGNVWTVQQHWSNSRNQCFLPTESTGLLKQNSPKLNTSTATALSNLGSKQVSVSAAPPAAPAAQRKGTSTDGKLVATVTKTSKKKTST